jgi:hypothetical protein
VGQYIKAPDVKVLTGLNEDVPDPLVTDHDFGQDAGRVGGATAKQAAADDCK